MLKDDPSLFQEDYNPDVQLIKGWFYFKGVDPPSRKIPEECPVFCRLEAVYPEWSYGVPCTW